MRRRTKQQNIRKLREIPAYSWKPLKLVNIFRFGSVRFGSFRFVSFRFVSLKKFRFGSFRLFFHKSFSFRFVSFIFCWNFSVSVRFVYFFSKFFRFGSFRIFFLKSFSFRFVSFIFCRNFSVSVRFVYFFSNFFRFGSFRFVPTENFFVSVRFGLWTLKKWPFRFVSVYDDWKFFRFGSFRFMETEKMTVSFRFGYFSWKNDRFVSFTVSFRINVRFLTTTSVKAMLPLSVWNLTASPLLWHNNLQIWSFWVRPVEIWMVPHNVWLDPLAYTDTIMLPTLAIQAFQFEGDAWHQTCSESGHQSV